MTPLPALFEKVRKGLRHNGTRCWQEAGCNDVQDALAALDEIAERQHINEHPFYMNHPKHGRLLAGCTKGGEMPECATLRRECRGEK